MLYAASKYKVIQIEWDTHWVEFQFKLMTEMEEPLDIKQTTR